MTLGELAALDKRALEQYFFDNAGYYGDAPVMKYAIRLGSSHLHSADTMDLRRQFERKVQARRAALARRSRVKPDSQKPA